MKRGKADCTFFLNESFICKMLNFETKPLFVSKAIKESSVHPPGLTFTTTEAEEKEVFSICCDDGADLVAGGIDGSSQALTLHPSPVLFREADVEVSVSLKDQVASVGCEIC